MPWDSDKLTGDELLDAVEMIDDRNAKAQAAANN